MTGHGIRHRHKVSISSKTILLRVLLSWGVCGCLYPSGVKADGARAEPTAMPRIMARNGASSTQAGGSPPTQRWVESCPIPMEDLNELIHPDWSHFFMKQASTGYGEAPSKKEAIENALAHALRQAVEQAVGVLVKSQTRIDMGRVIENTILASAKGFVHRYALVGEPERDMEFTGEGYAYTLKIRAEIRAGALKENLQTQTVHTRQFTFPVLYIQIDQNDQTGRVLDTRLTNDLIGQTLRSCFPGLEVQSRQEPSPSGLKHPSTTREADPFLGADYGIFGTTQISTESIEGYGVEVAYANSSARIVTLATDRVLGSTTSEGKSTKPLTRRDTRIKNAVHFSARMLARDLVVQFKAHLKKTAWANHFVVRLQSVSFQSFQDIMGYLGTHANLVWIGRKQFDPQDKGRFEVKFHGTTSDFAELLKKTANHFQIGMTITSMDMGLVEATLGAAKGE